MSPHNFRTSTVAALIVVALLSSARTVAAQPYATVAVGVGRNDITCATGRACEKDDLAFKFLGGYKLVPWIAIEAIYVDFGEAVTAARTVEDIMGTWALGGGVALHGSLASWTFTVRGGVAGVANERSVNWLIPADNPPSLTTTKVYPYGGAAIGYRISRLVGVDLGFDVTKSKWERSDGASLEWNATALTAGVTIGR
jgi:hypothetical protein